MSGAELQMRTCAYCGEEFMPTDAEQRYCRRTHANKANRKRRHGKEPFPATVRMPACSWCGKTFLTRQPEQDFCSPEHARDDAVCRRKEDFLTEEAAAAAARMWTAPGIRGIVEHYRCDRAGSDHWHLRNRTKYLTKRKAREQAG